MVAFCVTVDLLESIGTRGKARVHRGSQMGGVASRAVLHRDSWYLMAGGERRGERDPQLLDDEGHEQMVKILLASIIS